MRTWRWASRTPCSSFIESTSIATLRMRAWPSVDVIIENYTEIYLAEKAQLDATIAFFEKLKKDPEFHHTVTSDRGFLFEHFYYNKSIDPTLI